MSKLIEQEGQFYKECGIVLLENSKTKSNLIINKRYKKSYINSVVDGYKSYGDEYIHLYITSDDEIEEGDYIINVHTNDIAQYKGCGSMEWWKKIIAITDKTLVNDNNSFLGKPLILPQPSDKFIQAYIDAYNKGEKIEKVLVEYKITPKPCERFYCIDRNIKRCSSDVCNHIDDLLPKLKDNNIIIKKVKDSWSREELPVDILQRIISFGDASPELMETSFIEIYDKSKRWIEKNL